MDLENWKTENNCKSGVAHNSDNSELICICSDKTNCRELNGVKTGCPCQKSKEILGIPLWGWIIIGVVILIIIGYFIYYIITKQQDLNLLMENSK